MTTYAQKWNMDKNLVLIGMAGAGKSTIGREAARLLGWNFIDTDSLMEAASQASLEEINLKLERDEFLDLEAATVLSLKTVNTVIATGGSVIYRPVAIRHLRGLGPLLFIDVDFPEIMRRIALNPQRGLVRGPGQSLEELYQERRQMYMRAADMRIEGGSQAAGHYAAQVVELLASYWQVEA